MTLGRYWRTLRHLQRRQLVDRLARALRRPVPDLAPAPAWRHRAQPWHLVAWRVPSLVAPTRMRMLGVEDEVAVGRGWCRDDREPLWRYTAHYFEDLTATGAAARRDWHRALIAQWMACNPPGQGEGWDPYPIAMRVSHWLRAHLHTPLLEEPARHNLAVQVRWLSAHVEWHLLGNHLWANAKALVMAGTVFDGPEAARWRHDGEQILADAIDAQILEDGGHEERSPMYHALLLEDVLDLLQLDVVFPRVLSEALRQRLRRIAGPMVRWLTLMTHPDQEPVFFNDAAMGIAAPCDVLASEAQRLGIPPVAAPGPVEWLRASGYVRLAVPRAIVWCDVAPVGPDHQPGHAHADTLSFEMSVDGRRVCVNGGTSTYAVGARRSAERATRHHNTVEVNGEDSSEVWASFRVGRRARVTGVTVDGGDGVRRCTGVHDGYTRIGRPLRHARAWTLSEDGLRIDDRIIGRPRSARASVLWHPEVDRRAVRLTCRPPATARDEAAEWAPTFGVRVPTTRTWCDVPSDGLSMEISWR